MTKPANFPARKAARQGAAPHVVTALRQKKTKKTPRATWSPARVARRQGKGI